MQIILWRPIILETKYDKQTWQKVRKSNSSKCTNKTKKWANITISKSSIYLKNIKKQGAIKHNCRVHRFIPSLLYSSILWNFINQLNLIFIFIFLIQTLSKLNWYAFPHIFVDHNQHSFFTGKEHVWNVASQNNQKQKLHYVTFPVLGCTFTWNHHKFLIEHMKRFVGIRPTYIYQNTRFKHISKSQNWNNENNNIYCWNNNHWKANWFETCFHWLVFWVRMDWEQVWLKVYSSEKYYNWIY